VVRDCLKFEKHWSRVYIPLPLVGFMAVAGPLYFTLKGNRSNTGNWWFGR